MSDGLSIPDEVMGEVRCFVADFLRLPVDRVLPDTSIPSDLGVDGDDAYELLEAFADAFNVDMTQLRYHEHFADEGVMSVSNFTIVLALVSVVPLLWSWRWWAGGVFVAIAVLAQFRRWRRGYSRPLLIKDLASSAAAGAWVYPYTEADRR